MDIVRIGIPSCFLPPSCDFFELPLFWMGRDRTCRLTSPLSSVRRLFSPSLERIAHADQVLSGCVEEGNLGGGLALDAELTADLDALKDGLAVLVDLELGDDDVGGVDAKRDGLAVGLLAGDALDVDDVLEAVD